MLELIRNIACGICKALGEQEFEAGKPDITFYENDSQLVQKEMQDLGIAIPMGLWDAGEPYYYTTLWGVKEATKWIRKVYKFPKYRKARMDCDDFAILFKGLMSSEFGINDCAIQLGNTPMGYHAFNLVRAEDRRVVVEPQTGEVFEVGEKGYQLDRAVL